jgi:hypothetical protein
MPEKQRLVVKGFVFSKDFQRTIMLDVEITDPLTIAEYERNLSQMLRQEKEKDYECRQRVDSS